MIFEPLEMVFGHWEMISEPSKNIFEPSKIVSGHWKIISLTLEMISLGREIIFKGTSKAKQRSTAPDLPVALPAQIKMSIFWHPAWLKFRQIQAAPGAWQLWRSGASADRRKFFPFRWRRSAETPLRQSQRADFQGDGG